jgi:hypothetical protein
MGIYALGIESGRLIGGIDEKIVYIFVGAAYAGKIV